MSKPAISLLFKPTFFIVLAMVSTLSNAENVDPTKPFGFSGSSYNSSQNQENKEGFLLTSIIHGDGIHTAVINGHIYKMFDYVGEYRITAINSQSVILRSETQKLILNIFKSKGFKSHVVENTVAN